MSIISDTFSGIKNSIKSAIYGIFVFIATITAFILVSGTAWIEHEALKQLLPSSLLTIWFVIGIALCKILLVFFYQRFSKSSGMLTEGFKNLSIVASALLLIFATLMANITINSRLYKPNAQQAADATRGIQTKNNDEALKQKLAGIDQEISFLQSKLDKERLIKGKDGNYKGGNWKAINGELNGLRQQRQSIINSHYSEFSTSQTSQLDTRLTDLDAKNKVYAAYVYLWQDIWAGDRYALTILIVSFIFSLLIEILTITLSSYIGLSFAKS